MARIKKESRMTNQWMDRKHCAEEKRQKEDLYCSRCNLLTDQTHCPQCGSEHLRVPFMSDYCFFTEKELLWSPAMEELLRDHEIPFATRNAVGAGLTVRLGAMQERVRFYVPYLKLKQANLLEKEFFSQKFENFENME